MQDYIPNIRAQADDREYIHVQTELSEVQIAEMNEEHMQNSLEIARLNEQTKEINAQKNFFKKKNDDLELKARLGYVEHDIEAFYIDDYDCGIRYYYNEAGYRVSERKLKPSEQQQLKFNQCQNN